MANKDQFDLDIQVKSVSTQHNEKQLSNNGHTWTCPCHDTDTMITAMCSATCSCKCY